MEELQPPDHQTEKSPTCIKCGNPEILKDYPNALCYQCRESLIRFPIPLWVKLFGAAVLLMMIISLGSFPKQLRVGIHLKRGEQAIESKNYITAQREFEKVLKDAPRFQEGKAQMMIAAFYNMDLSRFAQQVVDLQGKEVEDQELLDQLNDVVDKANSYYPSDSFNLELKKYPSDSVPVEVYIKQLKEHQFDIYAFAKYASLLFEKNKNQEADSLLNISHSIDPEYMPTLLLKIQLKRELKQYDSALHYCSKALSINHQFVDVLSLKARVLMQQKKLKEALELSWENYQVNRHDGYAAATLALAYHFSAKVKERDDLMELGKRDTAIAYYMEYVSSVITGKEKF